MIAMKKIVLTALVAAVAASAAGARTTATPGVSSSTITLGGSVPLSGIASGYKSVAVGADAYFKYVNDHGGVNGRKIEYKYLDDEYDPSKALLATRQLVEQDNVFAIFNTLGTENNLAIRDYLKQRKVPQLFVASGATTFGHDSNSIGYLPSYTAEGKIYGRYMSSTLPKAKIAILFQDDAYTQDLINGFRKTLKRGKIVSRQGYDVNATDVASQIAKLKASGANTVMLFATPKYA